MPPSDDKEKVENEENEKNDVSDTKSNKSDKSDKSDKSKDTPKKGKGTKKGSAPDKMDPVRFQEGGVNFKAKLIGLENVPDARGDKMCQDAMQKLKGMVKSAKAHKPKITINVSLEGLKIIDDISQNVMHHHAVHKISFISRDITDARAFGYIYGLGEGKHQFFGIKTDKPAEGLVLTLRDLFQVVFEMKKQEVEAAKARKSAKEDDKSKDQDKNTDKASPEKPSAQEAPYDAGSAEMMKADSNPIEPSKSSADLLNLENQLFNLEVTFEQVDAFSAAAPTATPAAAAPQFPVSFEQNFGNSAMGGAQRDPFSTPTLAPPPNYGTQQQQQKPPMQQQQQPQAVPFPQPQPGDPFNTDPFGQGQFTAPPQPAPQQQASFAAFPPQGSLPVSPQHASPMPISGQLQMPVHMQQNPVMQQQIQLPQQQGAFGAMPVQKDPFKDDPFFTQNQPQQPQGNDRYAVFSSIGDGSPAAQGFSGQPHSAFTASLQPMQPMQVQAAAPPSPNMNKPEPKMPVQAVHADQFSDLANLSHFTPANKYVDRSQFFKKAEPIKPAMNTMGPEQVGSNPEMVRADSARSSTSSTSRSRPRLTQSSTSTYPFGSSSDPATDPFGSAPFTQPNASIDSQEPDPFDTSAILAKTHFQGPFDTSELKPSAAAGLSKPQALDISASSSTPPTTLSDKIGRDGTTSSNVSTPEDFSLPLPELPPPPLPRVGKAEILDNAPAPPPRPSFSSSSSSSSRPGMNRQATIDVGTMSRRSGRLEMIAFPRQTTIDFIEESSPPALPPRPPSSGPLSQPLSLPETPPPQHAPPPLPPLNTPPTTHKPIHVPHCTPPPLPKHDAFHSRTLPRQRTLPASQIQHANFSTSRQSTLPVHGFTATSTPTLLLQDRQWPTQAVQPQQDQFDFPPFDSKHSSTPPPFQAFKQDPFAPHSTPPSSPRMQPRHTPPSRQLHTPPLVGRQNSYTTPPTTIRHDSLVRRSSPNVSPIPGVSPSSTGTSMVARPRPRPRPRTPGGAQQSPTLTHVPENTPPVTQSTPPSARPSRSLSQPSPDPFARDGQTRQSERFPTEFSREAHQRQSDRTDVQTAARRVDSVKAMLRGNQSEPVFSVLATETITLPPEEEPPSSDSTQPKADPFPEGVDPFVDDSPIDPFSENDPFNKDLTQQAVAFRTKAIGSKDSESVKGSLSDSFVEDPFANDPFFTSGGKGTPVVSSPALARQGRKQSRDSVRSESNRSRTTSERSTSESQHDSASDPFGTVPIKRNDSACKARSDTSSVHSSTTPDPFVVDWNTGSSNSKKGTLEAAFPVSDFKDQSNVSSSSDLGETMLTQSKPTNGSTDPFDTALNGVSDSDSIRTDSVSLHSDPFASLDPFKFALGSKKPEVSWPTMPSAPASFSPASSQVASDSPRTQSPFRDPFLVDPGVKVNGSGLDFGESQGGREGSVGSVGSSSTNDNPFSSSQPQSDAAAPVVPARQQFQGNPFAAQNQGNAQPQKLNPFGSSGTHALNSVHWPQ